MDNKLDYYFFNDYTKDKDFSDKLRIRVEEIKNRYFLHNKDFDYLLKEYFVEIFSWTVFPKCILDIIGGYISKYNIKGVIDPCCGNAFHTYLFNKFLNLNTYTVDIQNEKFSWVPINEIDGKIFLKNLDINEHNSNALLLSWIDYESLTIELLNLFKGNMIISVGNYVKHGSVNYVKKLKEKYSMIYEVKLLMPWNLTEKIEIYYKK